MRAGTWAHARRSHAQETERPCEEDTGREDDRLCEVIGGVNEALAAPRVELLDVLTVNGVRFSFEDGSWGLIRASSNKPSLVVVTESPTSDSRKKKIFDFIDSLLKKTGKIGEYDQKI